MISTGIRRDCCTYISYVQAEREQYKYPPPKKKCQNTSVCRGCNSNSQNALRLHKRRMHMLSLAHPTKAYAQARSSQEVPVPSHNNSRSSGKRASCCWGPQEWARGEEGGGEAKNEAREGVEGGGSLICCLP